MTATTRRVLVRTTSGSPREGRYNNRADLLFWTTTATAPLGFAHTWVAEVGLEACRSTLETLLGEPSARSLGIGHADLTWLPTTDDGVAVYAEVHATSNAQQATVALSLAGPTEAALSPLFESMLALLPPAMATEDTTYMRYWYESEGSASNSVRAITVPKWSDIARNYAAATAEQVGRLMALIPLSSGELPTPGRLMLWHGLPGTGKTYAIRALAREWRRWCAAEYVTDPERLLGDAAYLTQVLMEAPYVPYNSHANYDVSVPDTRYRLLILEDAGELVAVDARDRTGQGLSRLLNTSEGLMGQGMNVIILITTNEPLQKIHPAVGRYGRSATVEFEKLSPAEADDWLRAAGGPALDRPAPHTLAELFGIAAGVPVTAAPAMGLLSSKASS